MSRGLPAARRQRGFIDRVPIQPATHDPALLRDESSRDCRSHYDPAYDELVYGQIDGVLSAFQVSTRNRPPANNAASREPVAWNEYAELMDAALPAGSAQSITAESTISVRSGRLLLDFAASALRDAGTLLQSAAEVLDGGAALRSEVELAGDEPNESR